MNKIRELIKVFHYAPIVIKKNEIFNYIIFYQSAKIVLSGSTKLYAGYRE